MTFVIARFVFGLSLAWSAVLILLAATWLGMRVIEQVVQRCDEGRREEWVMALSVLAVAASAVGTIYAAGHGLHYWIGTWSVLGARPDWLAGQDDLSAAAIFGAMSAIAALFAVPIWLNRDRPVPADSDDSAQPSGDGVIRGRAAARQAKLALEEEDDAPPRRKRAAQSAETSRAGTTAQAKASQAKKAKSATLRGTRRPGLAFASFFLLASGAAVLWLAFSVAPAALSPTASAYQATDFMARAERAQWVFQASLLLLAAGAALGVIWYCWRRRQ